MRIFESHFLLGFFISVVTAITGNAQSTHFTCGDFDMDTSIVADNFKAGDSSKAYVELNDGRKFYGDNLAVISANSKKGKIKIGDSIFRINDTRGYFAGGVHYGQAGNKYAKRVITGKINIYRYDFYSQGQVTNFRGKASNYEKWSCSLYAQKGDSTELILLLTYKDIKEVVKDCPKSLALIDKSYNEIHKAKKKNPRYLSEIISIYNNGCK